MEEVSVSQEIFYESDVSKNVKRDETDFLARLRTSISTLRSVQEIQETNLYLDVKILKRALMFCNEKIHTAVQ